MHSSACRIPTGLENLLTRSRGERLFLRMLTGRSEAAVIRRERIFALSGAVLGFGLCLGVLATASLLRTQPPPGGVPIAVPSDRPPVATETDSSVDPAMLANANLSESLSECSRQLALVTEENARLEQQLDAEHDAADAGKSALARRIARRDLSLDDWKQLARTGTVKYVLPCESFNPSPETIDGLGLEPHDIPVVRDAFVAARAVAWGQVRPLCAVAVGSAAANMAGSAVGRFEQACRRSARLPLRACLPERTASSRCEGAHHPLDEAQLNPRFTALDGSFIVLG
jgi:hypothetical protein